MNVTDEMADTFGANFFGDWTAVYVTAEIKQIRINKIRTAFEAALNAQTAPAEVVGELEALRKFAHEATKTITGLTAGGSEYFAGRIGDIFIADLPFCAERIRERDTRSHERLITAIRERNEARALLKEGEAAK